MTEKSDIITLARERYDSGVLFDRANRMADADDRSFLAGRQWDADAMEARKGRPMMTVNRLPQFVKQVTGDMRQNKPEIRALPIDDQTDPKLAEVYSAIIRHVESKSRAHRIYVKAAEHAVAGGIGWFRINTGYIDERSFDQDILVELIRNPLSVVIDPDATKLTREDMNWGFITEMVTRKRFEAEHPGVSLDGFDADRPDASLTGWRTGDKIRIAEYWTRERSGKSCLALLSDGSTVDITDMSSDDRTKLPIQQAREMPRHKIKWRRITGTDIIDEGDWAGKTIPLIPVMGEEIELGDETVRHGLIRFAKDAQRSYNYFRSAAAEHIGLQPKAPILATSAQIIKHKAMWDEINTSARPYALYDVDPKAPGKPERMLPPTTPTAMYQESQVADADMKATTGIYDASLGGKSNETSGVAIQRRDHQGEVSTYVYTDNLTAAIEMAGSIMVDLIPKVYTTQRVVRMIGEDGSIEGYAKVNHQLPDGTIVNDLSVGAYDVEVSTGPEYATKRQMAADAMMNLVKAAPQVVQLAGDIVVRAMDFPMANKIAERLEHSIPPGIDPALDAERQKQKAEQPPAPPSPEQQQQMQMQQHAALTELAQKEALAFKTDAEGRKLKAESALLEFQLGQADGSVRAEADAMVHQTLFEAGHHAASQDEMQGDSPPSPPAGQPGLIAGQPAP